MAGLLVANTPYYFSDLSAKPLVRDFIRLDFYWEDIDTSNLELINTPLYGEHIETYLKKVIKKSDKENEVVKDYELKKAIDVVIEKFSKTIITKRFAIEYLKVFFRKSVRKDSILNYVDQKGK